MAQKRKSKKKKSSSKNSGKVVDIGTRNVRSSDKLSMSDRSIAQELVYDAWETPDRKKRVKMAKKALEIWPDCADAYSILAEDEVHTFEEARAYYLEGIQAGERALGRDGLEENRGHFWGVLETRPYMRARTGLAGILILQGEKEEAAQHYREMLVLNPNDNQGLRYELAALLVELGRNEELRKLLDDNEGDMAAAFAYTRALLAFRESGDTPDSRDLLEEAFDSNPHVPEYLLVRKKLPRQMPDTVGMGDVSEAVYFTYTFQLGWAMTKGALDWMKVQHEHFTGEVSRTKSENSGEDDPDMDLLRDSIHEAVREQMDELNPAETMKTYKRLRSEGLDDEEAVHLIGSVLWVEMYEIMNEKRPFDVKKYSRFLKKLPKLPEDY